ncbi:Endolytic peptidoglycan transglycosylase RlpA [Methylovirgula sp. HY1]|nr:Endolytic peptidoglycan transglycosylase RlpA [Methylovirgula sp. HY1]
MRARQLATPRQWAKWAGAEFWRGLLVLVIFILFAILVLASARADATARCRASWYGLESGHRTANGERFRPNGLSIALPFTPHGERYRVCLRGRCVVVRHNDLGPARWTRRCADLSRGGARALGFERAGTALVEIERIR